MHLCFSCISYLSFGTEIVGETLDRFIGYNVFAKRGHQKIIEVMMQTKIIGESIKFIGSTYTQESLISLSLQLYISYLNKHIVTLHRFTSFITISRHLEFKVKIQNHPNKKIKTTTERSVPWSDLDFPTFAAKHRSIAQLFGGSYQLYAAICCIFQTLQRKIV